MVLWVEVYMTFLWVNTSYRVSNKDSSATYLPTGIMVGSIIIVLILSIFLRWAICVVGRKTLYISTSRQQIIQSQRGRYYYVVSVTLNRCLPMKRRFLKNFLRCFYRLYYLSFELAFAQWNWSWTNFPWNLYHSDIIFLKMCMHARLWGQFLLVMWYWVVVRCF